MTAAGSGRDSGGGIRACRRRGPGGSDLRRLAAACSERGHVEQVAFTSAVEVLSNSQMLGTKGIAVSAS